MSDSVPYVVALYIRLSIEDVKVESLSVENQKLALHKYADSMEDHKNIEVLEFIDNGYSGTNFERPAVQELLDAVRCGQVKCIIVKDFSRFGRNSIEVGYFMERVFPLYGVRFISLNDDFDSDTLRGDTGGINIAFKYLVSEFYSRDLSIKIMTSKMVKMKRGEYQGSIAPYGYRKGADGRLEPDEITSPNVLLIFELAQQGLDAAAIADELFRRSIPTPAEYKASIGKKTHDISRIGGVWHRSTIIRILGDERYIGTYVMGKRHCLGVGDKRTRFRDESEWIKIPNHHPPIVSQEMYHQVQQNRVHFKCIKQKTNIYPLRQKVFCGCCHHAMRRTAAKKPIFVCYHERADASAPCHGFTFPESELEATLYNVVVKKAESVLNHNSSSSEHDVEILSKQQAECKKKIQEIKETKMYLYEQFLLHEITLDDYKKRKLSLNQESDRLEQIYSSLCSKVSEFQVGDDMKRECGNLALKITAAGCLTSELADCLFERVYIYPDRRVDILWKIKEFCEETTDESVPQEA